jgi:transcriptional regulator with XRE-family HTH domain
MAVIDEFWARVNQLIRRNKTSQKKVAEIAGIPARTLEGWINKGISPTVEMGFYIARILGVSVEYLLTGKQQLAPSNAQIESLRALLKEADKKLVRLGKSSDTLD